MKRILLACICFVSLFSSCNNDVGSDNAVDLQTNIMDYINGSKRDWPELEAAFESIIADFVIKDSKAEKYVLHFENEQDVLVLTPLEREEIMAWANLIYPTHDLEAPAGEGWVKYGTGKGKTAAVKMAFSLARKMEKNRDFEVHVEYEQDGSFTIWYRYIK